MEADAELADQLWAHFRRMQAPKRDGRKIFTLRGEPHILRCDGKKTHKHFKLTDTFDVQLAIRIVKTLRTEQNKIRTSNTQKINTLRIYAGDVGNADRNESMSHVVQKLYRLDAKKDLAEIYIAETFVSGLAYWSNGEVLVCAPPGCRRNAKGRAVCGVCSKICSPKSWEKHMKCWADVLRL